MSVPALNWAKKVKAGSAAKKGVLMVLADTADRWNFAWDGQKTIAAEAEVAVKSVQRYTHDLAAAGLMSIYQGRNRDGSKTNLYRLAAGPVDLGTMPEHHPFRSGKFTLLMGPDPDAAGGEPTDRLSGGQRTGATNPTDRSNEPNGLQESDEPYRTVINLGSAGRDAPPAMRGGGASPGDLAEWDEVRTALRKEVGDTAFASYIKPLAIGPPGEGGAVVLVAPTRFIRDMVASYHVDAIERLWGRKATVAVGRTGTAERGSG